jgi:cysteine desulfurase
VDALSKLLCADTAVVSVMWANNEIGTLQDIPALAKAAHEHGSLFHTDATQAVGKIGLDLAGSGVDAASFSSHKVCGPKGVGALYLRTGTPCDAFMHGGGQESGRRSGTQNVMGIVGFAAACECACACVDDERSRLTALRDMLYEALSASGKARPTCADAPRSDEFLPNIANVLVPGFESETLILQLDIAGFAVSGGSACSTGSLDPSHVLTAIGVNRNDALCSLRISMGRYTAEDDIRRFIAAFESVVSR